ncbi:hypothetical protein V8E51_004095 [Hyaloscypha variabilis]
MDHHDQMRRKHPEGSGHEKWSDRLPVNFEHLRAGRKPGEAQYEHAANPDSIEAHVSNYLLDMDQSAASSSKETPPSSPSIEHFAAATAAPFPHTLLEYDFQARPRRSGDYSVSRNMYGHSRRRREGNHRSQEASGLTVEDETLKSRLSRATLTAGEDKTSNTNTATAENLPLNSLGLLNARSRLAVWEANNDTWNPTSFRTDPQHSTRAKSVTRDSTKVASGELDIIDGEHPLLPTTTWRERTAHRDGDTSSNVRPPNKPSGNDDSIGRLHKTEHVQKSSLESTSLVKIPSRLVKGTGGHAEKLDGSYTTRKHDYEKFFQVGRVFSVLWTDWSPPSHEDDSGFEREVFYHEKLHCKIRRFVVVRPGKRFVLCLPITPYAEQGVLKRGIRLNEHGFIYCEKEPKEVDQMSSMPPLKLLPLKLLPSWTGEKLQEPSLVNYGRVYTVGTTNLKVGDNGVLDNDSTRILFHNFQNIQVEEVPDPSDSTSRRLEDFQPTTEPHQTTVQETHQGTSSTVQKALSWLGLKQDPNVSSSLPPKISSPVGPLNVALAASNAAPSWSPGVGTGLAAGTLVSGVLGVSVHSCYSFRVEEKRKCEEIERKRRDSDAASKAANRPLRWEYSGNPHDPLICRHGPLRHSKNRGMISPNEARRAMFQNKQRKLATSGRLSETDPSHVYESDSVSESSSDGEPSEGETSGAPSVLQSDGEISGGETSGALSALQRQRTPSTPVSLKGSESTADSCHANTQESVPGVGLGTLDEDRNQLQHMSNQTSLTLSPSSTSVKSSSDYTQEEHVQPSPLSYQMRPFSASLRIIIPPFPDDSQEREKWYKFCKAAFEEAFKHGKDRSESLWKLLGHEMLDPDIGHVLNPVPPGTQDQVNWLNFYLLILRGVKGGFVSFEKASWEF